nr:MAG TPA: hypothetical protein [Caudoviricetes sp.]
MHICYNINSEIDFESLAEKFAGLLLCAMLDCRIAIFTI